MSVAKNTKRGSRWSSSEKKRFWELSKLLENTKLTFKCKINDEWIDVKTPLLDLSITASSNKDQEIKNGYPDKVIPRVLNPVLKQAAYYITEISKGTLSLRPEDILLALYPQIRASQRRKETYTTINEEYAIQLAGLAGTYQSNPRKAKKDLEGKLQRMKKVRAISGFEKNDNGYLLLHYREQKNKN
jgi:hypothetical protein